VARRNDAAPATAGAVTGGRKAALGTREPSSRTETANPQPKRWRDPFNPKTGEFADNIRLKGEDDLTELRESMRQFGWSDQFPALVDEHDVVLVGHRRLKVARELGIEPVIKKLSIGQGDAADAERLKLAIVSNIGAKPMTKEDRKRLAEYLYGEQEWTMARIAKALNVSEPTIHRDLKDSSFTMKEPSRPKGGRPKGRASETKPTTKKLRDADDLKRDIAAKKAAVAKPVPDKTVGDPMAPDEEIALLREFARFVIGRAKITTGPKDHAEFKSLLDRVKATLGRAS
jgi:ParB-like chromosome segregation protein Spo0J